MAGLLTEMPNQTQQWVNVEMLYGRELQPSSGSYFITATSRGYKSFSSLLPLWTTFMRKGLLITTPNINSVACQLSQGAILERLPHSGQIISENKHIV